MKLPSIVLCNGMFAEPTPSLGPCVRHCLAVREDQNTRGRGMPKKRSNYCERFIGFPHSYLITQYDAWDPPRPIEAFKESSRSAELAAGVLCCVRSANA